MESRIMEIEKKPCLKYWLLSLATVGSFGIYWMFRVCRDVNHLAGKEVINPVILKTIFTLLIIGLSGFIFLLIGGPILTIITAGLFAPIFFLLFFILWFLNLAYVILVIYLHMKVTKELNFILDTFNQRPISYLFIFFSSFFFLGIFEFQKVLNFLYDEQLNALKKSESPDDQLALPDQHDPGIKLPGIRTSPWLYVLSLFTYGIFGNLWIFLIIRDLNKLSGKKIMSIAWPISVVSLIFLPSLIPPLLPMLIGPGVNGEEQQETINTVIGITSSLSLIIYFIGSIILQFLFTGRLNKELIRLGYRPISLGPLFIGLCYFSNYAEFQSTLNFLIKQRQKKSDLLQLPA